MDAATRKAALTAFVENLRSQGGFVGEMFYDSQDPFFDVTLDGGFDLDQAFDAMLPHLTPNDSRSHAGATRDRPSDPA